MELQRLSMLTRVGHGKAAASVAEHVATLQGPELLADMQNVKAASQHAATVFAWADQPATSRVRLEVLLAKPEAQVIECESQVIEADWTTEEQA
jgi:hypothetical protein